MSRHSAVAILIAWVACATAPRAYTEEVLNAERDLIALVGKRISVVPKPTDGRAFDLKFEARYQVLQMVFGRYEGREITFTVFDHYGKPPFSHFDTVLLFVARHGGKLSHEKYLWNPIYMRVAAGVAGFLNPARASRLH